MLELGKSLALECTVTGFPIHQVVFRHNQKVIKSISGLGADLKQQLQQVSGGKQIKQQQQQQSVGSSSSNYFVLSDAGQSDSDFASQSADPKTKADNLLHPVDAKARAKQDLSEKGADDNESRLSHVIVIVLEPEHAGAYQCFAYNQYESVQSSAYIRVLDDPPKFRDTFKSQVFEQRQDVSLQCSARANPLPEITWSIDSLPIPESSRLRFGDFVTKVSSTRFSAHSKLHELS